MGVFVDKNSEIKVTIFSGKNKDGIGIASSTKEDIEAIEDQFDCIFSRPNYKNNVDLFSNATSSKDGQFTVDFPTLRYLRVVQLIKSWTLKDVRVSVEAIDGLRPEVGEALQLRLEVALAK